MAFDELCEACSGVAGYRVELRLLSEGNRELQIVDVKTVADCLGLVVDPGTGSVRFPTELIKQMLGFMAAAGRLLREIDAEVDRESVA